MNKGITIWSNLEEYIARIKVMSREQALSFVSSGGTSDLTQIKRLLLQDADKETILEYIDEALQFDKDFRERLKLETLKGEN